MEATAEFGYTLATGRVYQPISEFHRDCEKLMDRPIWTHEFGNDELWKEMREEFERQATVKYNGGSNDRPSV